MSAFFTGTVISIFQRRKPIPERLAGGADEFLGTIAMAPGRTQQGCGLRNGPSSPCARGKFANGRRTAATKAAHLTKIVQRASSEWSVNWFSAGS